MAVDNVGNQKTMDQIIAQGAKSTSDRKTGDLGKDDFLKLLVTQLRYQDPLKPTDDKEFIGQMAQFSSLEQMQNMNSSLSNSQGFSLIGKHITANIIDDKTKETQVIEGDVSSVKVSGGKTYVVVKDQDIPIDKITNVTDGMSSLYGSSTIAQYTNLIGFDVLGGVYDSSTSNIVAIKGKVTSIAKGQYENYALMDGVKVDIAGIVSSTQSTDPNYIENYLKAHMPDANANPPVDNTVSLVVTDRTTGQEVPITAKLTGYTKVGSNYSVTLDQVAVPVESIASVTPIEQKSQVDSLLQQILDKLNQTTKETADNTGSEI